MDILKPSKSYNLVKLVILVLIITGCDLFNSASNDSMHGVQFLLNADSTEISSGSQIPVTFSAINTTDEKIEIGTGCWGFVYLLALQDTGIIALKGTGGACRTAPNLYELEPKSTLDFEWNVGSYLLSIKSLRPQPMYDTTLVEPGTYTLRAVTYISSINGKPVSLKPQEIEIRIK